MSLTILPPSNASIALALDVLQQGLTVALPTETVYGLAANAYNTDAIARIFTLKGRPSHNPLITHYPDVMMMDADVILSPLALDLFQHFAPGPLTLVLPRRSSSRLSSLISQHPAIAVRIPLHPLFLKILNALDFPLAAPSANVSGFLSPTTPDHVVASFTHRLLTHDFSSFPILDGGKSAIGLESTIVSLLDGQVPQILRYGAITPLMLSVFLPTLRLPDGLMFDSGSPLAPGMLSGHYAPKKPMRLNATWATSAESFLSFGQSFRPTSYVLSAVADLNEAAANLFSCLWAADADSTTDALAIMPIPMEGIGIAINERLVRAAGGKR